MTEEEIEEISNRISKKIEKEFKKQLNFNLDVYELDGVDLIRKERCRQFIEEGYSIPNDYEDNSREELANAAAIYAMSLDYRKYKIDSQEDYLKGSTIFENIWPWSNVDYKPNNNPNYFLGRIRELTKAGALIAAEIDRIKYIQKLKNNENNKNK